MVRFRGKCSKHPHFDPHEGLGAIKGGCKKCEALFYILKRHGLLMEQMRQFSPPREMSKFKKTDDRQMGLFTEASAWKGAAGKSTHTRMKAGLRLTSACPAYEWMATLETIVTGVGNGMVTVGYQNP